MNHNVVGVIQNLYSQYDITDWLITTAWTFWDWLLVTGNPGTSGFCTTDCNKFLFTEIKMKKITLVPVNKDMKSLWVSELLLLFRIWKPETLWFPIIFSYSDESCMYEFQEARLSKFNLLKIGGSMWTPLPIILIFPVKDTVNTIAYSTKTFWLI